MTHPLKHPRILLLAALGLLGTPALAAYSPPASDAQVFNFNPDWRFAKGSFPLDADDAAWTRIATPHTYHDTFAYFGLKNNPKDLGPHTYRKHFKLPDQCLGRKVLLEFQGVRQRATIYLNGQLLGRHQNGVTPFGFDLTPHLRPGENVLHLEIDCINKDFLTGQEMCWFFPGFNPLYGGICRNVSLHVVGDLHATLPLYSFLQTSGTYVYAEDISTEKRTARIGAQIQIANDAPQARQIRCQLILVDRQGNPAGEINSELQSLPPQSLQTITLEKNLENLHFWQPDSPYLYDLYTIIREGDRVLDVHKIVTGFRKLEVRNAALYVNNRVLMTHGYTPRAQNEWPAIGNAYPDWLHDYSNHMMVEGHARLVRWEHTMPSPQDISSCDRVGLPQIIPGADRENDSVGREWELRKEIMRDTLIYSRNHPSIFFWEAANNVLTREHTQEMINLRNEWDPRGYRRPMGGRSEGPEWVSWMYGVRKEKHRLSVDTEFMRDEGPRRWWDAWSPPYCNKAGEWKLVDNAGGWNRNQDNMCQIQSIVHEQYYRARPGTGEAICNGGVQIFFADSDSFTRSVDSFRRSGPVDGMRIPKDAYGCNQTMWSNTPELWTEGQPAIYLPGHWNYPAGTVKPIYAFVSPGIEAVELQINGRSRGLAKRTNTFLFTFENVAWEAGRIEVLGRDASGQPVARAFHQTAGEPAELQIKVITNPTGLQADGNDLALLETQVVDAQGRRCPLAQPLIRYELTGPAIWRGGIWEENVPRYANARELPLLNGVHRVFLRSNGEAGAIQITARSEGLKEAGVTIRAKAFARQDGLSKELPAGLAISLPAAEHYGPDLPPAPAPRPEDLEDKVPGMSSMGESIFALKTAFPAGATLIHGAADGGRIYQDEPWVFQNLPSYLVGADYLQVANADAKTSAGEGVVFKIGTVGRVYVAYDDANDHFPTICSPTGFGKTKDKILINGRSHTLYRSGEMNGGELTYLGTNNWTDAPPAGAHNYVVFIVTQGAGR